MDGAEGTTDLPELLAEVQALRSELAWLRATQSRPNDVPAWKAQRLRLDARDAALREAVGAAKAPDRTKACRLVAATWAAALRGVVPPPELATPIARAIEMHGDKPPVSWVQIANIARGNRTPCASLENTLLMKFSSESSKVSL